MPLFAFCIENRTGLRIQDKKMQWIDEADKEILIAMIEHSPVAQLVSFENGEIFYANAQFREWSRYSMNELRRLGWMRMSVDSESLEADLASLKQIKDGYIQTYSVQKKLQPNNSRPELGTMSVMRYPASGEIKLFLCTWIPVTDNSAAALEHAMSRMTEMQVTMQSLKSEIEKLTSQTPNERVIMGVIKLAFEYPKTAVAILTILATTFGLNNIVELLQRTGFAPLPAVPVSAPQEVPANANAMNVTGGDDPWKLTSANGTVIGVPEKNVFNAPVLNQY